MTNSGDYQTLLIGPHEARVYPTTQAMGAAAAKKAAEIINAAIRERGQARVIVATGNSQDDFIDSLMKDDTVDWGKVEAFHMDEYLGLPDTHPASFRKWLKTRVVAVKSPARFHLIEGDAEDIEAEIHRYTELLNAAPIDVAFIGFGENGHIAFNDPPVADFEDPATLKVVTLDEDCRRQQVGEGHFPDLDSVPKKAVTITCPGLFRAKNWVCCVPERRKAEAVKRAFHDPVSTACPATLTRTHPSVFLYLDRDSASLLPEFH